MGLSRSENILEAIINDEEYTAQPESRLESLLIQVGEKIAEGGSGTVKSVNGNEPDEDGNVTIATGTPQEYDDLVTDVATLKTTATTLNADIEELSDGVDAVKEELAVLGLSIDEDGNIIDSWIEEE